MPPIYLGGRLEAAANAGGLHMGSFVSTSEFVAVGAILVGAAALDYLLPLGGLPSLLLVVFVVLVGVFVAVPGAWPALYRRTGISTTAWLLAAAVAATGIAASYLVGDPRPFCDGLGNRGCLTPFGWAASIYVGSAVGVAVAAGHLGRYRRLGRATAVPAADVEAGLVAVEGRIVPSGSTHVGPVSDEEAVWYRRARERPTLFGGYREVERETVGNEFYVADGSGRLLVLPDRIDGHAAAEFAAGYTEDDGDDRRREWSYRPDDAVTVVGRASRVSRADYPAPHVVGLDGPALVGDRPLDELRSWAARRAVMGGALAAVFGGASLLVMLLTA